ncbi:5-methyltetrahydrofolate--homocysteine methyltransferase [hydrothermal vent metagenome]|uniref:methionine synthase n=1 Tax=hydrothermal vent metagenome TaxID=652676 RepID=A0A3B1C9B9_9ZZZZ
MSLLADLEKRIVILDGSMGALLQNRGLPAGHAPDLWNLENPDPIIAAHREYADAGADIVLTNTFGASRLRLAEYNAEDKLKDINKAAVAIARKGAPNCYVAGDIGPLGGIMAPAGDISFDEAISIFMEQATVFVEEGVDLIAIETMFDLMEMKAAVIAINEVRGGIPILASMTYGPDGVTDTGTDPVNAAVTLEALDVDIIAVNCSVGPEPMVAIVERLATATEMYVAVEPNAGLPVNRGGKTVFEMPMAELASYGEKFVNAGANIVGGCCGSTPEYIRMIANTLKDEKPRARTVWKGLSFTSRMVALQVGDGQPFVKIGEKINPTGRKKFAESIKNGRVDMVVADARKQYEMGALALDVNVGVPLVDEAKAMERAVTAIQNVVPVPLVIDSSYSSALEAGLKVYPGRALINSINGEKERLEEVGPLVKKYGASVIALLAGDDIPEKARDRVKIAGDILRYLEGLGVPKERVVFDCLALVVSAMQNGARETLETIRLVKSEYGCATVAGISNVSFGLPQRKAINNSFLAMAMGAGLDSAIVNPYDEEMTRTVSAASLFCGRDHECRTYIDMMEEKAEGDKAREASGPKTILEKINAAIVEGDKDSIAALTQQSLDEGNDAMSVFVDTMTPAIRHLGVLFAQRKKFIPHLVAAADTMKRGVAVLDPILKAGGSTAQSKGTVIFATVKGDIHDIGKNICVIMLSNFGFNVIDLGKNVPVEDILSAAEEHNADVIGLSALMTTTMMQMQVVVDEVRNKKMPQKIMVGGAVVTKSFASEIGADAYGKDVGDVVSVTEDLVAAVRNEGVRN